MSTLRAILALTAVLALTQTVQAQQSYPVRFDLGTTLTPQDLAELFAIPPDGRGLPPGKGTYAQGEKVYADSCAVCHGDKLQGNPTAGIGGDKLIGGRGTLASAAPVKTVESYWPYATTLFDYIKRSMPFTTPGSLTDEQVYSVVAYILGEANIVPKNARARCKESPGRPNAQSRWLRGRPAAGDPALPLRPLLAMAQKFIERMSRWQRKA
jgi:S-disulfanyl-L-cysteine oxidoreductase SoxD